MSDDEYEYFMNALIAYALEGYVGVESTDLTNKYLWKSGNGYKRDDLLIRGGYKEIVNVLAEDLDIILNKNVV